MTGKTQFGGNHYLKLAIQPREFAMRNGWDSDSFSILKYLTRYPDKAGIEDVRKARHFAEMRRDWPHRIPVPPLITGIPMSTYIRENDLPSMTADALIELENWVYSSHLDRRVAANDVIRLIDSIIIWLDSTS
jgi:hypothetical protein